MGWSAPSTQDGWVVWLTVVVVWTAVAVCVAVLIGAGIRRADVLAGHRAAAVDGAELLARSHGLGAPSPGGLRAAPTADEPRLVAGTRPGRSARRGHAGPARVLSRPSSRTR